MQESQLGSLLSSIHWSKNIRQYIKLLAWPFIMRGKRIKIYIVSQKFPSFFIDHICCHCFIDRPKQCTKICDSRPRWQLWLWMILLSWIVSVSYTRGGFQRTKQTTTKNRHCLDNAIPVSETLFRYVGFNLDIMFGILVTLLTNKDCLKTLLCICIRLLTEMDLLLLMWCIVI
jgi:hypothetical protein